MSAILGGKKKDAVVSNKVAGCLYPLMDQVKGKDSTHRVRGSKAMEGRRFQWKAGKDMEEDGKQLRWRRHLLCHCWVHPLL